MFNSGILDTRLHKSILNTTWTPKIHNNRICLVIKNWCMLLNIVSVIHYKKQKRSWMLPTLPKEEIARFLGIMMKVLTPRTLEMSLQRAPQSCTMKTDICCFTYYFIFMTIFYLFISLLFLPHENFVTLHQRHLCIIRQYWIQNFRNLYWLPHEHHSLRYIILEYV